MYEVENKKFIYDVPFRMSFEEAKKDKNFLNCKRFVDIFCQKFDIQIDDDIKQYFLMANFFLLQRKKFHKGWSNYFPDIEFCDLEIWDPNFDLTTWQERIGIEEIWKAI